MKMNVKKGLAVAVLLLFISVSVIPSTGTTDVKQMAMPTSSGNTLYVGGNGTGNYSKIQDAIDNASDGDTVFVYDDSSPHYENVVVDKSINLIGEDKETTIIDGGKIDDVINVTADRVNISGFTIQNCGNKTLYIYSDAGIDVRADYCTISGNIFISNCANGIALLWANNNVISDNILVDNEHTGIHLSHYSNNNTIRNNTVEQSHNAIYLIIKCENNTIINNIASYCELAGINFYWDCNNNIVSENTIINNYEHGIWLYDSHNNSFFHNTLVNNWVRNARDKDGNNSWDNGYPSGGNFWDDYNGTDDDGDGIGDTPYNISGGSNQDRYPLMEPYTYKNTTLEIGHISTRLFRISAVIKNIGEYPALQVNWSIKLDGGLILLGKESSGNIPYIPSGESQIVYSNLIIGFGQSQITITADALNAEKVTKIIGGFIVLIFIIIR